MTQLLNQINHLFNAAIDAAAPQQPQPTEPIELTQQDRDFFVWLARHG